MGSIDTTTGSTALLTKLGSYQHSLRNGLSNFLSGEGRQTSPFRMSQLPSIHSINDSGWVSPVLSPALGAYQIPIIPAILIYSILHFFPIVQVPLPVILPSTFTTSLAGFLARKKGLDRSRLPAGTALLHGRRPLKPYLLQSIRF